MTLNNLKNSHSFKLLLIAALVVLVSVTIIIRVRTIGVSLDRDCGEYAYAGQLLLQGSAPYASAYNMKMPGIYAAYAVILACFGQSHIAINTGILIINTLTIILLFLLAKKLFDSAAALACSVFFAITSISDSVQASANAENFVVLFAIAGILLMLKFHTSNKYIHLVSGAILLGIAFMMKQHGAGFIIFGMVFLLWSLLRQRPFVWKNILFASVIYCFSVILPFLLTCFILWYCGVFEKFWFWTFTYAHQYVSIISIETGIELLSYVLAQLITSAPLVWLSAVLGLLSIFWNKEIRKRAFFLVSFLACSFLAVCPGLYFRNHYFLLFLPSLCLLASVGVIAAGDLLSRIIKSPLKISIISILIIVFIWLQSFYAQRDYLLETDLVKISRMNFNVNPFPESLKIAEFIKNNSKPDAKIAILGSEPQIYFYSQRRSATSYIYTFPLMEPQIYAADMQREMINQIEANRPEFIVFVKFSFSWGVLPTSEKLILDWSSRYLAENYVPVGLVEVPDEGETVYQWGRFNLPTVIDGWVMIWQRKNLFQPPGL